MINPNYKSYRDSAARVVAKEDGYYRYIFYEYRIPEGLFASLSISLSMANRRLA